MLTNGHPDFVRPIKGGNEIRNKDRHPFKNFRNLIVNDLSHRVVQDLL